MGIETKYLTRIRKHFLMMKPSLMHKITKVKQSRYQIMSLQKSFKVKKESFFAGQASIFKQKNLIVEKRNEVLEFLQAFEI
jgi:hypothetical protein